MQSCCLVVYHYRTPSVNFGVLLVITTHATKDLDKHIRVRKKKVRLRTKEVAIERIDRRRWKIQHAAAMRPANVPGTITDFITTVERIDDWVIIFLGLFPSWVTFYELQNVLIDSLTLSPLAEDSFPCRQRSRLHKLCASSVCDRELSRTKLS